jgi:hypothetical protein
VDVALGVDVDEWPTGFSRQHRDIERVSLADLDEVRHPNTSLSGRSWRLTLRGTLLRLFQAIK